MAWRVEFFGEFESEFFDLDIHIQNEILAKALVLEKFGPNLGRPHVDTLKGSKYSNMKELRFRAGKEMWRVAFAFDPDRNAILLAARNKKGKDQSLFYSQLILTADDRFNQHIIQLEKNKKHGNINPKGHSKTTKRSSAKNKSKGK